MKKIILFFLVLAAGRAKAQTPWYIGGNAVSGASTFGTTTPYDIKFILGGNPHGFLGAANTGLGSYALSSVSSSTGVQNCAFGNFSLQSNTTGNLNNAFGNSSLVSNTSGYSNNAFGAYSLQGNSSGIGNSAFGENSLFNNTSGALNSGIGNSSLYANTTGSYNIAVGSTTLSNNTTGSSNVAIGYGSGATLTTGSANVFIGTNANPNIGNSFSNQLNIGNWIYGYNGSIGIGALNPGNRLEVTAGTAGYSGLRFTNLPNSQPSITNPTTKVLSVDANGDVILVDDRAGSGSASAAEGLTFDGTSIVLGADCGTGGGAFSKNREINMRSNNLYFNSSETGKLYMGSEGCKKLVTRLEIGTKGLTTVNGYDPAASPSGLRFTDLTAATPSIDNQTGGVLSLDRDGDVIWVKDQTGTADVNHWDLNGNTITAANYLGTNNNMDLVFKRGGIPAGRLEVTNTTFGVYSFGSNTTGTRNSALGAYALSANTTGTDNAAIGFQSLFLNTTGSSNTSNGITALYSNTTGDNNTASGKAALLANTTGNANTADGLTALVHNTTGNNNTGTGATALWTNTTGNNNTGVGMNSLFYNVSGNNNTAVGYNTGNGITTGSGNTIVGANVNSLPTGLTNTIILADGTGTKRLYIDNGGNAGLATTAPTAALHVNCTGIPLTGASNVRFENLQTGSGNVLVIDANGYVKKASATASKVSQEEVEELRKELNETRQALEELKAQVNALSGRSNTLTTEKAACTTLTIVPAPFSSNAKAVYSIENFKGSAVLQVLDARGALLKKYAVNTEKGEIALGNIEARNGAVFFNIIMDGRMILSKQSVKL